LIIAIRVSWPISVLLDRYNVSFATDFSGAFAPPSLCRELEYTKAIILVAVATFGGGDDSILTPEDEWKYTTPN
jgi:hypothetical protein